MISESIPDLYRERTFRFSLLKHRLTRRINLISLLRLITFCFLIGTLFLSGRFGIRITVTAGTILVVIFLFLVRSFADLTKKRKIAGIKSEINAAELNCVEGDWNGFDDGREYDDEEHSYCRDLDIFGPHSLFQYLNRSAGIGGKSMLAAWLKSGAGKEVISRRQETVQELAGKLDWRQDFQVTGRLYPESREDRDELIRWVHEVDKTFLAPGWRVLLLVLPSATLALLVLSLFLIPFNIPVMLILIQLGIVSVYLRHINSYHNQVSRKYNLLKKFSTQLSLVENADFDSALAGDLQKELSLNERKASSSIRNLAGIADAFDRRLNMLVGSVLDALLMWDLQCITRLERWKRAHRELVPVWLKVVATVEALNSLGCFRFNNPSFVFPEIDPDRFGMKAGEMGHPLIPEKERVCNDFRLDENSHLMLITGSNMAGKSTFLRTCGINMVLGMAGAPVCAEHFRMKPMKILTSMRVSDSLHSRESTFYAELRKLKKILMLLRDQEEVFLLLDEILKGTNSRDKHTGSEMFIRQLADYRAPGMIATHDLELGSLERGLKGRIRNYCFEVRISNSGFHYDYKLREGIAQTLNATELMEQMGIRMRGHH